MINLFSTNRKKQFMSLWSPVLSRAKCHILHEKELPALSKKDVWFFIEEWNKHYEQSSKREKTGLSVLAYQLNIHRYAAGMLINSKYDVQLSGIVLLGYMGDESAWPLLKSLSQNTETEISQAAFLAMKQINIGRVIDENNHLETCIKQLG